MPALNAAKGVLVVDPLECRGIRYSRARNPEVSRGVYVLFQTGTVVLRTYTMDAATSPSIKWDENSQCRFDINPDTSPVLKVFVMQSQDKGIPICLAKGELNLIDVFYQKECDRWVNLSPVGQLNVELTFYEVVPMLPQKKRLQKNGVPQSSTLPAPAAGPLSPSVAGSSDMRAQKMISSVDRVFEDDVKEERSRLKKLAKRVRRRYHDSVTSNYSHPHKRKSSQDMLTHEVQVSPDKELPDIPFTTTANSAPLMTEGEHPNGSSHNDSSNSTTSVNTIFSRARAELSSMSLNGPLKPDDLDLSNVPFSASSIGTRERDSLPKLENLRMEYGRKRDDEMKAAYVPLSAEMYALVDRLEKGLVTEADFRVDEGISLYNGDGSWARGCLRDSVPTGSPPVLPPKIPVGMKSEEFFVLNKEGYIDYFRTVRSISGL